MIDEHTGTWAPIKIKFACENYLVSIRLGVFSGIGLPTAKKKKNLQMEGIYLRQGVGADSLVVGCQIKSL